MTVPRVLPASSTLGHLHNLLQKADRASSAHQELLVAEAQRRYDNYLDAAYEAAEVGDPDWVECAVSALGDYLDHAKALEKEEKLFNWRSDYAGSIIPEFIARFSHLVMVERGLSPEYSGRRSVVELTLGGDGRGWSIRRKNQDLCIGLESLSLQGENGKIDTFMVPLVAVEVKTNLDINKLSGLNFSAESLKRSFPLADYFIVTETIDFSLSDNYVGSGVDEIYVMRKAMRSKHRHTPASLQPDVFFQLFNDIAHVVDSAGRPRGHGYDRLESGKLIDE